MFVTIADTIKKKHGERKKQRRKHQQNQNQKNLKSKIAMVRSMDWKRRRVSAEEITMMFQLWWGLLYK
jgi:hypothetical protein